MTARFKTAAQRRENASALDDIIAKWSRELEPARPSGCSRRAPSRRMRCRTAPNITSIRRSRIAGISSSCRIRPMARRVEGPRAKLSRTPAQARRAAPTLGQDNQYVLEKILGYDEDRIGEIVASGVLG